MKTKKYKIFIIGLILFIIFCIYIMVRLIITQIYNSFSPDEYEITDISTEQQEMLFDYFTLKDIGEVEINEVLASVSPHESDTYLALLLSADNSFQYDVEKRWKNSYIIDHTIENPYSFNLLTGKRTFMCEIETILDDNTRLYKLLQTDNTTGNFKVCYLIMRSFASSELILLINKE